MVSCNVSCSWMCLWLALSFSPVISVTAVTLVGYIWTILVLLLVWWGCVLWAAFEPFNAWWWVIECNGCSMSLLCSSEVWCNWIFSFVLPVRRKGIYICNNSYETSDRMMMIVMMMILPLTSVVYGVCVCVCCCCYCYCSLALFSAIEHV